jgi:hypothetical protein
VAPRKELSSEEFWRIVYVDKIVVRLTHLEQAKMRRCRFRPCTAAPAWRWTSRRPSGVAWSPHRRAATPTKSATVADLPSIRAAVEAPARIACPSGSTEMLPFSVIVAVTAPVPGLKLPVIGCRWTAPQSR